MNLFNQAGFDIRCEWGLAGIEHLAPDSDAIIIVDVLSFTTSVDIATSRGCRVYPFTTQDEAAQAFADQHDAVLASRDRNATISLSPLRLLNTDLPPRLVLPSPNGSTLAAATGNISTLAACLRNARAVAFASRQIGQKISVIPAGERWQHDGSLRMALEDWIGAGAVIHALQGNKSPEALAAQNVFEHYKDQLLSVLKKVGSGLELIERGFAEDIELAAALNVSRTVPQLADGAFVDIL